MQSVSGKRWRLTTVFALGLTLLVVAAPIRSESRRDKPVGKSLVVPNCRVHLIDELRLASEQSGVLAKAPQAGEFLVAGSVVAQLRDSVSRAKLAIAEKEAANEIEVRFARKATELAQAKYERTLQANRAHQGTVTEFELRELRLAAEKSLLQLEQAEHQLGVAGLRLAEQRELHRARQLVVPFDAFVRVVHYQPGEYIREGDVILEVVNTDRVRLDGYISSADAGKVVRGTPVSVRLTAATAPGQESSKTLRGRIDFVDVKVEPLSKKVRVTAEVANENRLLRDGLTATMVIHTN